VRRGVLDRAYVGVVGRELVQLTEDPDGGLEVSGVDTVHWQILGQRPSSIGPMSETRGAAMNDITISDNPDASRYEAFLDGDLVGFATYQLARDLVVFTHTEVEERCEGLGVGAALVKAALDDVREKGLRVLPLCPFVKAYIGKHREYVDLVYGAPASRVTD
jgi:predicted GNAT family acetyltransferase